jgi:hypothetical protein
VFSLKPPVKNLASLQICAVLPLLMLLVAQFFISCYLNPLEFEQTIPYQKQGRCITQNQQIFKD